MALANSRLMSIPTVDDDIIANSKSPLFDASTLGGNTQPSVKSESGKTKPGKTESKVKKNGSSSFTSSQLTETVSISKTIPVTGERPKPGNEGPILNEDDVLYAIFVILWESDPNQQGMTVKQLCDLLLEKHPDMNNLSTKLSNLISAKLNAYVKKVEKGEKGLVYSLSREWSDASPRRMVYIYRCILAPDYEKHAQAAAALVAASSNLSDQGSGSLGKNKLKGKKHSNKNSQDMSFESDGTQRVDIKDGIVPRSSSALGGMKSSNFSTGNFVNDFNIPYMSSPVSVSLAPKLGELPLSTMNHELDIDSHSSHAGKRLSSMYQNRAYKKQKTDAMKIHETPGSVQNVQGQPQAYLTIAGSTPRLSKSSLKHNDGISTAAASEAAPTVAELLRTAITQNPIVISPKSSKSSSPFSSTSQDSDKSSVDNNNCKWLQSLREGFLLKEIPTPESLSPDDFDEFFA